MKRSYIGIGSNIDRNLHIVAALDHLTALFGRLIVSPVYESEAIGFIGQPFLNLVIGIDTDLSVRELQTSLRAIERANGHSGNTPKFSDRSLDLDLLTYGESCGAMDGVTLPRTDIVDYAYVLWPLVDIAGAELHPQLGISYHQLQQQFTPPQKLWPVPFLWQGRDLSELLITTTVSSTAANLTTANSAANSTTARQLTAL